MTTIVIVSSRLSSKNQWMVHIVRRLNLFSSFLLSLLISLPVRSDGDLNELLVKSLAPAPSEAASEIVLYPAKRVITMNNKQKEANAVAVNGKRILMVGSLEKLKNQLGTRTYRIDPIFDNKIVMPGFIDQHLHPVLGALTLATEIIAPEDWVLPDRTVKAALSGSEYQQRLKQAEQELTDPQGWLISWGYHALWHGKLDRAVLDKISSTRPIMIWQRSCHEFILNTAALNALNITEKDVIDKGDASRQVNYAEGHFWEQGLNLVGSKILKQIATPERLTFGLKQMVAYEQAHGVTAFNEPGAIVSPEMWALYEQILGAEETPMYSTFIADGRAIVDRVGIDKALDAVEKTIAIAPQQIGKKLMFFPNQIKLFADGAIISQLMQMKQPYTDGHQGEWITPPKELDKRIKLFWDAGYQIHVHVNGDQGLDVVLNSLQNREKEHPRADHRFVIVHFANSDEEQIKKLAQLGAIVSTNPYYTTAFSDKYAIGLGKYRADHMVRSASVLKATPHLSFHSDLPMAPSDPLYLVWAGVNRMTTSGRIAAPEQRISVDAALRAITIEAAYSWRKEDMIGSIEPGKIANFTVLEEDPYQVNKLKIKDIPVWGTMFEGKVFPVPQKIRARMANNIQTSQISPSISNFSEVTKVSTDKQGLNHDFDNCQLAELSHMAMIAYSKNSLKK